MGRTLKRGDTVEASTVVHAAPQKVFDVVSDVCRIPEWSPECVRVEMLTDDEFRGFNKRRFGRWKTRARIVTSDSPQEFAFVVRLGGRDFTRWTYRVSPHPEGSELVEEVTMCMDLPLLALAFERLALGVRDRRSDLQGNLDSSLRHLRAVIQAQTVSVSPLETGPKSHG